MWFAIGDVSGHGVTPGLIMMMAQTSFNSNVSEFMEMTPKISIQHVNKILRENVRIRLKETHFMTMLFLKYKGNGKFLHAGSHTDIIIYRKNTNKCIVYKTKGIYLGIVPDISEALEDIEIKLETGDILALYTDGLIEAKNNENMLNGVEWLMNRLIENADEPIDTIRDKIFTEIMQYSNQKRDDDMTLILARYIGG
jgi:serine phosphatase RsbU (regulator of sigma subunit)